jgi:Family of unknown function (DUF6169)
VSNSLNPYSLTLTSANGAYSFQTDNGILYTVDFEDASYYIEGLSPLYQFSFYPKDFVGSKHKGKMDVRVRDTILTLLNQFFIDSSRSLIFICESLDSREKARFKLFDNWFKQFADGSLEKYDKEIEVEVTSITVYGSLIIHKDNTDKDLIFQKLAEIIPLKY